MQQLNKINFLVACSVLVKITLKIYFTSTNMLQRTSWLEQIACYWIKSDFSTENTERLNLLCRLVRYKAVHTPISIVLCSN